MLKLLAQVEETKVISKSHDHLCTCTCLIVSILSGNNFYVIFRGRGVVASLLVHSTPDRAVRLRDLDVVFIGKTLHSHSASLHPGV